MQVNSRRERSTRRRGLGDGAWHTIEDLRAATRFPSDWVDELQAEGIVDVKEGLVTMVRLRRRAVA